MPTCLNSLFTTSPGQEIRYSLSHYTLMQNTTLERLSRPKIYLEKIGLESLIQDEPSQAHTWMKELVVRRTGNITL